MVIIMWLSMAMICLLIELMSPGLFFFFSFFIGALCGAGASLLHSSLVLQAACAVSSAIMTFFILSLWLTIRHARAKQTPSNVYTMHGKRGLVIQDIIPAQSGYVKIGGEVWLARTVGDQPIKAATQIEVIDIRGCHVIVQNIKQEIVKE